MNAQDYFNARLEATISPMDYMMSAEINPQKHFLIDVRNGPSHLRNVSIQGAKIIPEQELQSRLNEIPKDKKIVVYCWDVWCNTASKVAVSLLEKGYKVKELSGGIAAWQQMNFPVTDLFQGNNIPDDCGC